MERSTGASLAAMAGPAAPSTADAFPDAGAAAWRGLVDQTRDGPAHLAWTTADGLTLAALADAVDGGRPAADVGWPGFSPLIRGSRPARTPPGWDLRALVDLADPAAAGQLAERSLGLGALSLEFHVDPSGDGRGIHCTGPADLDRSLTGVLLGAAPVALRARTQGATVAGWFDEVARARGLDPDRIALAEGLNPLGAALAEGTPLDPDEVAAATARATRAWRAGSAREVLLASGLPVADAGGSEAQEIGWIVSSGVAYLRALDDAGIPVADAVGLIGLAAFADVDLFATVAKLRAVRHCWASVLRASGLPHGPLTGVRVHSRAGGRWLTAEDPWLNVIRATIAALGAVLGGTDSLTVLPYDWATASPGAAGQRLALTTGLVLAHETGIGRVLDPTGGSSHVEQFTAALAAAGWAEFQRLERAGGCAAALATGAVAEPIAAIAAGRVAGQP